MLHWSSKRQVHRWIETHVSYVYRCNLSIRFVGVPIFSFRMTIDSDSSLLNCYCYFITNIGVDKMAIALQSDNPIQYNELMQGDFNKVCGFVVACVESGLEVECTAVKRDDVKIEAVRALAMSLGATNFTTSAYFP